MAVAEPVQPPTLDEVEADLKSLRSRAGISQVRVDKSKALLALPIVSAEQERRGFADPSVALYSVIECAVDRFSSSWRERLIVRNTLNLSGAEAETLEERRWRLEVQLGMARNTLWDHEALAYRRLASWLIRSEKSPCGQALPDETDPNLRIGQQVVVAQFDPLQIAELVRLLANERSPVHRARSEALLRSAFPRLNAHLTSIAGEPLSSFNLTFVMSRTVQHSSGPWGQDDLWNLRAVLEGDRGYKTVSFDVERYATYRGMGWLRRRLLRLVTSLPGMSDRIWHRARRRAQTLDPRTTVEIFEFETVDGPPTSAYQWHSEFLKWFGATWLRLEEKDGWLAVLVDDGREYSRQLY